LLLAGCGEDPEPTTEASASAGRDEELTRGAALYARYCALCHGENAEGYAADDAPALVTPEFLRSVSDRYLIQAIADGRPGTAMSAWHRRHGGPLGDGEIRAIVRHLRSFQRQPRVLVDGVRVDGRPERGRAVYVEHCARCHGAHGEGVNAVSLANPAFLASASDGFVQYAVSHGRSGTPMPAFAGRLTPQQIDDVVAYVRSLGGDAGTARAPEPTGPPAIPPLSEMQLVINPSGPSARFTLRDGRYVPAAQVKAELERGARMIIIDARATSDWLRLRIPGAIPVPYYELNSILEELPRDGTWMIAYCGCPHAASGRVVDALRQHGFTNTAVLDEGIHHWEQQGYPTASGAP
jgi:mono/diheme cytochrome c family protein/rhodanese-related sulfurtransferase